MFIIDFEASGLDLNDSYPVQVAILNEESQETISFIIKPVEGWTYWDEYAEDCYHNLSRELLNICGSDVKEVAQALNEFVVDAAYCDGYEYDSFWFKRLFEAAGITPTFEIKSVYELAGADQFEDMRNDLHFASFTHNAEEDVQTISQITLNYR